MRWNCRKSKQDGKKVELVKSCSLSLGVACCSYGVQLHSRLISNLRFAIKMRILKASWSGSGELCEINSQLAWLALSSSLHLHTQKSQEKEKKWRRGWLVQVSNTFLLLLPAQNWENFFLSGQKVKQPNKRIEYLRIFHALPAKLDVETTCTLALSPPIISTNKRGRDCFDASLSFSPLVSLSLNPNPNANSSSNLNPQLCVT